MAKLERKNGTYMSGTGKILCDIGSDTVDSLCAACRNEPFGLDCCHYIGRMGIWDTRLMENQIKGDQNEI